METKIGSVRRMALFKNAMTMSNLSHILLLNTFCFPGDVLTCVMNSPSEDEYKAI